MGRFAPRGALADELAFRRGLEDERASVGPRGVSRGPGPASSPASSPTGSGAMCASKAAAVRHRQCVTGSASKAVLVVGRQAEPPHYPPRQIVLFVGFLEWWSEFAPEVHCTKNEG